jgi:hypothetical protein
MKRAKWPDFVIVLSIVALLVAGVGAIWGDSIVAGVRDLWGDDDEAAAEPSRPADKDLL